MKKDLFLILVGIILISLDRITKLSFGNSKNYGFLFGILKNNIFFCVLTIIILLFLIYFYISKKDIYLKISLIFIISGVLSNLIDRLYLGYVIDFINLGFWPSFNLADIYNIMGVIFFLTQIKKW